MKRCETDSVHRSGFSSDLALPFAEAVLPLYIKESAEERPKVITLDGGGNASGLLGTEAQVETYPGGQRSLLDRAEEPRRSSVDIFFTKKRSLSLRGMTIGRQSTKMMKGEENEAGIKAKLEVFVENENLIDARPADSGTLRSETESA